LEAIGVLFFHARANVAVCVSWSPSPLNNEQKIQVSFLGRAFSRSRGRTTRDRGPRACWLAEIVAAFSLCPELKAAARPNRQKGTPLGSGSTMLFIVTVRQRSLNRCSSIASAKKRHFPLSQKWHEVSPKEALQAKIDARANVAVCTHWRSRMH
jgi:hypothetical protein